MPVDIQVYLYKNSPHANWCANGEICRNNKYIHVVQGEAGSVILNFHLLSKKSEPLDLTNKTVTFYFTKPDGQKIYLPADIDKESAAVGLASVTLTAQSTAASGITKHGVICITGTDDSVLKLPSPDIYIEYSNMQDAIESTSEFHALDVALNSANSALQKAESACDSAQTMLDSDRQAVSNASDAANNANSKAGSADKAANNAENAAQSANTSAESANSAAKAANNAADSASTAANGAESAASKANDAAQSAGNAVSDIDKTIEAEVKKHASRTDNPHSVTAEQIGAASKKATVQSITPSDGLKLGSNQVCKIVITDTVKIISAELVSTKAFTAGAQLMALPNLKYGYFPKVIFVNGTFCYAWIYGDGSLKTLQDIPANANIVIDLVYV